MTEFKVGDRVKRINYNNYSTSEGKNFLIGDTGTISGFSDNEPIVLMDKNKMLSDGNNPKYLEIIEPSNKSIKLDKHLVVKESCNNLIKLCNTYEEAIEEAKKQSVSNGKHLVYKLIEVATTEAVVQVKKTSTPKK